jgi:nucleotide-binding universal stress UspA family protein
VDQIAGAFFKLLWPCGRAAVVFLEKADNAENAMLKNLLVHIPSERTIRPIVDCAISLAVSRAAHLDAVSIGYENTNVGLVAEGGAAAAVAAAFEIEHTTALARADAALAVFEAEARNAGISYNLRALASVPVEAAACVGAMARLHDLTIVQQPEPEGGTFDNTLPQEILFQSGGPVLFVPYIHKGPLVPKRVGIAWDGSRTAARALRDAAPFLSHAQAITIIGINDAEVPEEASVTSLATHLARRGLAPRIERLPADRNEIQPTILSIAADNGLDLIVMGGYGRSRFQERILGGVTRSMLRSMTVPTLMSH